MIGKISDNVSDIVEKLYKKNFGRNIFLFAMGRLSLNVPAIIQDGASSYADPLPQALVLTAIVISFGMTAFVIVLSLKAYGELKSDHVDGKKSLGKGERIWFILLFYL